MGCMGDEMLGGEGATPRNPQWAVSTDAPLRPRQPSSVAGRGLISGDVQDDALHDSNNLFLQILISGGKHLNIKRGNPQISDIKF